MVQRTRRKGIVLITMSLIFCIIGVILISPFSTSASEINNEYLLLNVQDNNENTGYGSFTLKKAEFEQTIDTLTYAKFYSAFTTVNLNGKVYKYDDGEIIKPLFIAEDGSLITVMSFNGVEITQRLVFSTGNSTKEDMLLIHYTAANKTNTDILISIRILIDPTLSNSETDLIQTNNKVFETEDTITGSEIPATWFIKNDEGDITAFGMIETEYTEPDIFQVANWNNLYDARYGYVTDSQTSVTDNAVAISWNNKIVAKNDTLQVATKYGLYSEAEIIPTEPATEQETEPATEAETRPATEQETEPATEAETRPATEQETEPATEAETKPATEQETEPATEAETKPATEQETEPATEVETKPVIDVKPTDLSTQSATESTNVVITPTESATKVGTQNTTSVPVVKSTEGTKSVATGNVIASSNNTQGIKTVLTGENTRDMLGVLFFIGAAACMVAAFITLRRKGVESK